MIIGMLGLIILALLGNIAYYEYLYIKRPTKSTNIVAAYVELERIRRVRSRT